MDEGLRQAFDRAGDRLALEQRFAAGPAQVPDPAGVGLKVARKAEDLLHRRVNADPGEVSVLHAGFAESFEPELTRVADSARLRSAEVARPRELPGNSELLALPDDVRLGHVDQGSADLDDVAFDASLRTEAGDLPEGRVILRAAVRISRVVDLIGGDH